MFELTRRNNNRHVNTYNPFREMEEFERNFFTNPFGGFFDSQDLAEFKTDVTDEGDNYLLEADLPGFDKKDSSEWSIDYALLPNAGDAKLLRANVSNGIIQGKVPKNYSQNSRSYKVYVQQANSNKSYYV